jgi:hypothetical protein
MVGSRCFLVLAIIVALQGCSAPVRPAEPDPVSARGFLPRNRLAGGLGAYGYVLFTAAVNEATRGRYALVCDAFLRHLQPLDEYPEIGRESLLVTFWVLHVNTLPRAELLTDCGYLVDAYDYARAEVMATAVGKQASTGPLLVVWHEPFTSRRSQERRALILDLSGFSAEDVDRAFRMWQDGVARDPQAWREGFDLDRIHAAVQRLLQAYGPQIVQIRDGQ